MNDNEILQHVLRGYFSKWELDLARSIRKSHGHATAIEELRRLSTQSQRGAGGPDMPGYCTRPPFIEIWGPEHKSYHEPPRLRIKIIDFCKSVLDNAQQMSLL